MQVLWSLGQARLGQIQDALNHDSTEPVAPSTVATQLHLLMHKGYVTQTGRHGRSLYVPTCSRQEATRDLLDDFLNRVGLGRTPAFLIQLLKDENTKMDERHRQLMIIRLSAIKDDLMQRKSRKYYFETGTKLEELVDFMIWKKLADKLEDQT